ncbi:MAG: DUF362 domain-containing protein [Planctomycetota bacterium]
MSDNKEGVTRRGFLQAAGAGVAALGAAACGAGSLAQSAEAPKEEKPAGKSRVVLVRDPKSVSADEKVDAAAVGKMLDEGLLALFGTKTIEEGLEKVFTPKDVVGIRVNCNGQPGVVTQPALAHAIASRLARAKVPENNIVIWERREDELESGGYKINTGKTGVRVLATDSDGFGFDEKETDFGSGKTCWSRIQSSLVTASVNAPVVKTNTGFGITNAIKYVTGLINNPGEFHDNKGVPYCTDLYKHPVVKDKTRLVIADALVILTDRGPHDDPRFHAVYGGILLGFDPVAVDRIAMEILEKVRGKPVRPFPDHVKHAGDNGLGVFDRERIELVEKVIG